MKILYGIARTLVSALIVAVLASILVGFQDIGGKGVIGGKGALGGAFGQITGLTLNVIPKAASGTTVQNSSITDNGTTITTSEALVVTGQLDGYSSVNATTTSACTLGATSANCGSLNFSTGYTFNQESTAGTGVTYTLPATVQGKSYCVKNSIVSGTGAATTGVLTVYPPASSYVILNGTRNTIGGGGTHGVASGGAAGDAACFTAVDATDWEVW